VGRVFRFHSHDSTTHSIGPFDILCGLISLAALLLLIITGNGLLSLILSMVADFSAGLPTIIKAYTHPESESIMPYALAAFSAIITLLTVKHWAFAVYSFSAYILLTNLLIGILASRSLRRKPNVADPTTGS
jgi:hypothetical protein